jgi:hypothetical protein
MFTDDTNISMDIIKNQYVEHIKTERVQHVE